MISYGIQQNLFLQTKSKASSERASIVEMFVKEFNAKTIKKYQLTPTRMAMKLAHIKGEKDLYEFLSSCRNANNFGKYFNWAIKPTV